MWKIQDVFEDVFEILEAVNEGKILKKTLWIFVQWRAGIKVAGENKKDYILKNNFLFAGYRIFFTKWDIFISVFFPTLVILMHLCPQSTFITIWIDILCELLTNKLDFWLLTFIFAGV